MNRLSLLVLIFLFTNAQFLSAQDLNQLRLFNDQSGNASSTGNVRSTLLKNYFSSFSSDDNIVDRLSNSPQASPSFPSIPLEGKIDPNNYILGVGDVLEISISNITPIIIRVPVNVEGTINIPNVGSFEATEKTLSAIKPELILKLKKIYKDESINISLINPRSFIVTITGSIRTPGKYVVSSLDRLDKVILQSNLFTSEPLSNSPGIQNERLNSDRLSVRLYPNSNPIVQPSLRRIKIQRKNGSVLHADLIRFFMTGDKNSNPMLHEGDVISVENLASGQVEKIGINGAVQIPIICEYNSQDSITTLLRFAQGPSPNADLEHVQLIRENNGKYESRIINVSQILEGKASNIQLLPNDRIQVPEINYTKFGNITLKGEVIYPGFYSIQDGKTTLKEIISLAGGFTDFALLNGAKIYRKPKPDDPNAREPISITDPGFERARIVRGSNLNPEEAQTFDIDYGARRNYVSANFKEIFQKDSKLDIELIDGDVIIIPKDEQTVYIVGQVQRPGFVKYMKGWELRDYIEAVGGETSESTGDIKVIKSGSDEWKNPNDTEIESGDWIIAPKKVRKTFQQIVSEYTPIISLLTTFVTLGILLFQVTR